MLMMKIHKTDRGFQHTKATLAASAAADDLEINGYEILEPICEHP